MAKWVSFKEIKEKVTMAFVLAHYGLMDALTQKGDNLVGACPIHKGKNKNQFHVSLAKNNFNCFGDCHGGGNVIDFVSRMEGVSIREAGLLLQEWFQIEPEKEKPAKKEGTKTSVSPKEEAVNTPLKFSLKNLDPVHTYLKERGLKKETIEYFGLGYCSKGLMKGRIAVPIHDETGALVAYIGRWPGDPPEEEPKYKLPAGFHKAQVVFNLHRAQASGSNELILVEGIFDCLKVWQAGFPQVVALMGSSLSRKQEELILKVVSKSGKISLMFDEDKAGHNCRSDCLKRFSKKAFVKVIELEPDFQPDQMTEEEIQKLLAV